MPRRTFRSRANQLAQEPESLVMIESSGRRGDSSNTTRCGLIGSALTMARFSRVFSQLLRQPSTFLRQRRERLCSSSGNNAESVSPASPTRLTSMG
ncbi:hypothetical protein D3C73_1494280 [compost metagenome]